MSVCIFFSLGLSWKHAMIWGQHYQTNQTKDFEHRIYRIDIVRINFSRMLCHILILFVVYNSSSEDQLVTVTDVMCLYLNLEFLEF